MNKKIGLYFGSFNPVHHGHLLVATHIREAALLDEVWFIVSPQNPFKQNTELADEQHRLQMVRLAIENIDYFKASDVEFQLDKPSYTYKTLEILKNQYTQHEFKIIIGEDNVAKFDTWKNVEWIKSNFEILVYSRNLESGIKNQESRNNNIFTSSNFHFFKLPMLDISSTEIRNRIKLNRSIQFFSPDEVVNYIIKKEMYKLIYLFTSVLISL